MPSPWSCRRKALRTSCRWVSIPAKTPPGATTCLLFESCHAPLCPLDQISLNGVWYADEEICRSRSYTALPWIRSQRKIGRVKARGYFTLEMLRRNCIVKKGIACLDADAEEEPQLRRWLADHPERSGMSEEKKAALTFATRLVQNGVDLYRVQKLGRWKTTSMIMRYAHHYPESLRPGIETMDRTCPENITNLSQPQKSKGLRPLLRLVTP